MTAEQAEPARPLSKEELINAWREYASTLPPAENYLRTIMATEPDCERDIVMLDIITQSQAMICENKGLIDFLRDRLKSPNLTIRTRLIEKKEEEAAAAPFTSKQKLEAMLAENKNLHSIIERFGLSLDF